MKDDVNDGFSDGIEQRACEAIDTAHNQAVVNQMITNAEQSIQRADKIRASLESIEAVPASVATTSKHQQSKLFKHHE